MKKLILITIIIVTMSTYVLSQVVISSDADAVADKSAVLDVQSASKGILLPKVSLTSNKDVTTISNPEKGLLIYNVPTQNYDVEGFLYWDGNVWRKVADNLENVNKAEGEGDLPSYSHAAYIGAYNKQDFSNGVRLGDFCFKIARDATSNDYDYSTNTRASGSTKFFIKYVGGDASKPILYRSMSAYADNKKTSDNGNLDCTSAWKSDMGSSINTNSSSTSTGIGNSELEKRQYIITPTNYNEKYFYRLEYMISGDYLNSDAKVFIYVERIAMPQN